MIFNLAFSGMLIIMIINIYYVLVSTLTQQVLHAFPYVEN